MNSTDRFVAESHDRLVRDIRYWMEYEPRDAATARVRKTTIAGPMVWEMVNRTLDTELAKH